MPLGISSLIGGLRAAGPAWTLLAGVLFLDVLVALWFAARQVSRGVRERLRVRARSFLAALSAPEAGQKLRRRNRFVRRHRRLFLDECSRVADTVELCETARQSLGAVLEGARLHVALLRDLHARNRYRRTRAAVFLPLVPSPAVRACLIRALEHERSRAVRLALAGSLTAMRETAAIPTIIDTLSGEPLRYQRCLWGLLGEFGEGLAGFLPMLSPRPEKEIQLLLVHFAERHPSPELRDYLVARVESADLDVRHAAFRALISAYLGSLDHEKYLSHDDFLIRNLAAESLGGLPTGHSLGLLLRHLDEPLIGKSVILGLGAIVRARPQHFRTLMMRCLNERRSTARAVLVEVLSGYVEYLMEKLTSPQPQTAARLLLEILKQGKTSDLITFLNRNTNPHIERRALYVLAVFLRGDPARADLLRPHLDTRLLTRLGLRAQAPPAPRTERREHPRLPLLYAFLAVGVILVPGICLALALLAPQGGSGVAAPLLERFFAYFNTAFAVYAATLNGSYLLLLVVSAAGVARQARYHSLQRASFLFKEGILPSVSIITPAFNEEASIVESVNALLNLRYPDYEIIVVNDGSRDRTLEALVSYFRLERADVFVHRYLNTQEIRGIYTAKDRPELLVIDKVNGGKADSLNAGINVARKEYFAGIDADSLLERDALLNLAGMFLQSEEEVVAAGGNILPVNGCTVSKGDLVETRIPERAIARFQTVEYLRAFMAGRVGWATLKALLIISGAFGVFHRRRVVDAHGYLTRSEHYLKDTVGEDMELVVRLSRSLRDKRIPFAVAYGYNANCWTEIPESLKILGRQRDRWQRGLLDIVSFHFRMMFNPAYGRTGLIGLPYFLVFEVIGPWFEAQGYLVVAVSLALGMIRPSLFLLVFAATILMGLLVSTASLVIAESRGEIFRLSDKLRLLLYAVLENFGFRQLISLLRLKGFLRMLRKAEGWGVMERRGLKSTPNG